MSTDTLSGNQCGCSFEARQSQGQPTHCVCPACGEKVRHRRGTPCREMPCPRCGTPMRREFPGGGQPPS